MRHDAPVFIDNLHLQVWQYASHGGNTVLERIVHRTLERNRRGLRHAVADGDLPHVHAIDHLLHQFHRTRGAGHHAGAQTRKVALCKARMLEHRDEHGWHAMQRSASLRFESAEHGFGAEALIWIDHRRAVRDADEIAEHHAETVVQRHGDTQTIDLTEMHRRADEVAVVEDVVMRERGALRMAG